MRRITPPFSVSVKHGHLLAPPSLLHLISCHRARDEAHNRGKPSSDSLTTGLGNSSTPGLDIRAERLAIHHTSTVRALQCPVKSVSVSNSQFNSFPCVHVSRPAQHGLSMGLHCTILTSQAVSLNAADSKNGKCLQDSRPSVLHTHNTAASDDARRLDLQQIHHSPSRHWHL